MTLQRSTIILLLIILLALLFRIPAILNSESFWFDEVVSLEIAKKSIANSWQYLQWENNPPLHYWFLHWWIKLFGESAKILRLSSVLFNVLSIIAIYFLGKKLINKQVGLIAGFLLAISSYQTYLATDVRMYPMLLFFGILSCCYFWEIVTSPPTPLLDRRGEPWWKNWFLYIFFTTLTFYTHLTGLFLFIIYNLYFVYRYFCLKQKHPSLKNWICGQLIILILFLPWLYFFILKTLICFNGSAWYLHTPANGFFFFQMPFSYLFAAKANSIIEFTSLAVMAILFIFSFLKFSSWSDSDKKLQMSFNVTPVAVLLLMLFLVPLFTGVFTSIWVAKYYLIGCIGFYPLLAIGFYNLKFKPKHQILFLILILSLSLPYNFSIIQQQNKHQWHQVAKYVKNIEQADDLILIPAFIYELPFNYYYQGNLDAVGYEPSGLEDDLLLKAVKYNWYTVLNENNMPDMGDIVNNKTRVIVIYATVAAPIHRSDLVLDWFSKNGWYLEGKKQFGGFVQPEVLVFTRMSTN